MIYILPGFTYAIRLAIAFSIPHILDAILFYYFGNPKPPSERKPKDWMLTIAREFLTLIPETGDLQHYAHYNGTTLTMIGEAAVLHHARYGAPSNLDFAVSRWEFIPGFEREMIAAHPKKFRHSKGKFEINPDNSTDWVVINLISIDMLPFHPSSMVPFGTVSPNDIPIMPIHELVSLEAACCSCQGTEFVEQAAVHAGNVFALLKSPPQATVSLLGLMTARQIKILKISAYRLSLLHFDTGWTDLLRTDDIGEFAHSMMDIQR